MTARVVALTRSITALEEAHDKRLESPFSLFQHNRNARKCECGHGDTIRTLMEMRKELLKKRNKA